MLHYEQNKKYVHQNKQSSCYQDELK